MLHVPHSAGALDPTAILRGLDKDKKLNLPTFPTMATLRRWRFEIGEVLVSSNGYTDMREISWLAEVMADGQSFDALANSGPPRFTMLDLRLSGALTGIIRVEPMARAFLDDLTA